VQAHNDKRKDFAGDRGRYGKHGEVRLRAIRVGTQPKCVAESAEGGKR